MRIVHFLDQAPLVAIRFNMAVKNSRETLHGILRYASEHGPWSIRLFGNETDESILPTLEKDGFLGFIGHINSRKILKRMSRLSIPIITVDEQPITGEICCDNANIAQEAANFFLKRNFQSFAYVNSPSNDLWSRTRRRVFSKAISKAGFSVKTYNASRSEESASNHEGSQGFISWLESLPMKTALFVANDECAIQVINACRKAKRKIPQDLSILSCDNDELLCETSSPTISSIQMTTEAAGYQAARTLDTLMHGTNVKTPAIISYRFGNIVERSSTASIHTDSNPLTTKALTFLRLNHASHFTTDDLARELHVSRRTLETHFRAATGKSIRKTLSQIRVDAACTVLRSTNRTIEDIALSCGFASASHLDNTFRKLLGQSPNSIRRFRTKV